MKKTFYSNGKLLITGEYVVLDGADAFALPTKKGQYLHIETNERNFVSWKSYDDKGAIWYEDNLPLADIRNNVYNGDNEISSQLTKILHTAHLANPEILISGYAVSTELTFAREWGLGTSSTLINNIAQWFGIDAYQLLRKSFGGSGYDIACAQNDTAVIYRIADNNPTVAQIGFKPPFLDKVHFVYLNQKQNSRSAIAAYREKQNSIQETVAAINAITAKAITTASYSEFCELMEQHEEILSAALGISPVKERLFPDFNGTVKSLGAWGGDFVMVLSESNPESYFKEKGYDIIVPYNDMIL